MLQTKYAVSRQNSMPNNDAVSTFLAKDGKITIHKDSGMALGVSSAFIFAVAFIYMYGWSYNFLGKNKALRDEEICFPIISMSSAFQHTEKIFPTIMVIIFLLLMQFYYNQQHIFEFGNENDAIRILCVVSTYFLVIAWFMLFYVLYNQKEFHAAVAFVVLLFTTMMCYTMYKLYDRDYQEKGLEGIKACAYMSITVSCLLIAVSCVKFYRERNVKVSPLTKPPSAKLPPSKFTLGIDYAFNILEVINIVVFFIFLVICSTLPPLVKQQDITCVITG